MIHTFYILLRFIWKTDIENTDLKNIYIYKKFGTLKGQFLH